MKVLTVASGGADRPPAPELKRRQAADECPRVTLYEETMSSDMLDERWQPGHQPGMRALLGRLPFGAAHAAEAYRRRHDYAALISWGEHFGLPLAALLKATRSRTPHVALFSWLSTPSKAAILKRVHSHISRLVLWSSAQYNCAVDHLGIPAERVVLLRWLVDDQFWRPLETPTDMFCAAGREMRDYPTLIDAIRDWPVPCRIAAKLEPRKNDQWRHDLRDTTSIPPHITIAPANATELRMLYARSRFVVIPLYPTDTDNGVTVMTEAMAMGKPVICSRVDGQRDVLQHGVTGLFVPPGDGRALREAIEYLWKHPDECRRMGQEARHRIERYHRLEDFIAGVQQAVDAAIADSGRPSAAIGNHGAASFASVSDIDAYRRR